MQSIMKRALGVLIVVGLGACVSRADIDDLKQGQKDIIAGIADLKKNQGPARPAGPPPQQGPDPSKVYAFPVGESPSQGPKDAWVTIVEVSDFQCPFCGRAVGTMKEVEQKYGNDVRIVFKNNPLPFHNRALPAALAATCAAEQNKFWPLHDKMFANQRALEDDNLNSYATEAGIDTKKLKSCMGDEKAKKKVEEDQMLATKLGARGTPAFFINGRFLSGAQPFPTFQAIIDEELKKAQASGIDKKEYYAKAVEAKGEKTM